MAAQSRFPYGFDSGILPSALRADATASSKIAPGDFVGG
jgi:hypothetical protein